MAILDNNKILIYGGYSKEKLGKDAEKGITHTDMWYLTQDSTTGENADPPTNPLLNRPELQLLPSLR